MAFPKEVNTNETFMHMDVATAIHQLKLNYSKTKDFPIGKSISSPSFSVAGIKCQIHYHPRVSSDEGNFIGLSFALHCKSEVIATVGVSLLDKQDRPALKACRRLMFTFSPVATKPGLISLGKRSDLEAQFLKDDCFTVVCSVTILSDSHKGVPKNFVNGIIPGSTDKHFSELLESKEMADVTFEVEGETFTAHRLVLSARSPVFKAELFGEMAESKMKSIQIKDIKPVVFKAMLHFIYTDTLLYICDEDTPFVVLVQHLLEAADRYALDGLKVICEERLIRDVSVDTVISSLALAEEHNVLSLKLHCLLFASEPENLTQLALRTEYNQLMQQYPSLLENLDSLARVNVAFNNLVSRKQRNN